MKKVQAYGVHLFTSLGAVCGIFALYAIAQHDLRSTFMLMAASLLIDGVDGTLARYFKIKQSGVRIEGELLDNIIDYLTYVVVPIFYFLTANVLPSQIALPIAAAIAISSAFQFTQADAKTDDHFFKGFPSYWNLIMFYIYLLGLSPQTNAFILTTCVVLVFIPIKYIYPSRPEFVFKSKPLQKITSISSGLWTVSLFYLLFTYPTPNLLILHLGLAYSLLYLLISIYRTFKPLR